MSIERATAATERLKELMGWPDPPKIHKFEVVRMLWGRFEAVPIRVEYVEQLAERIERLEAELAAYKSRDD